MLNLVRVGTLKEGDEFLTLHTRKHAVVLECDSRAGARVEFEDGTYKNVAPDVVVQALVVHAGIR